MKTQILNFVNETTDREYMDVVSTKDVASHFGITTEQAYGYLNSLAGKSGRELITKLEPADNNNFNACDWVKNE